MPDLSFARKLLITNEYENLRMNMNSTHKNLDLGISQILTFSYSLFIKHLHTTTLSYSLRLHHIPLYNT